MGFGVEYFDTIQHYCAHIGIAVHPCKYNATLSFTFKTVKRQVIKPQDCHFSM